MQENTSHDISNNHAEATHYTLDSLALTLPDFFHWSKCEGPQDWKWIYNGSSHKMTGMDEISVLLLQPAALFPTTL